MLERKLAFQNGVADHVGEDQPRGVGRKFPALIGAVGLEALALFQEIVEAVHEFVVGGAVDAGPVNGAENGGEQAAALATRDANLLGEAGGQNVEGFRSDPDAVARGVEIGEDAEDAAAVGGASGKRVDVRQVVSGAGAGGTAALFDWPEAGEIAAPAFA